jgi:hypothetical protein
MTAKEAIAKLELQTFYHEYDAIKTKQQKKEITYEQFVKHLIKLTVSIKPKRVKKAKVVPKYKRITIAEYDEFQKLKAK